MHDFFKGWRFKVLAAVGVLLLAFMVRAAYTGGLGTMASHVMGAVLSPLQKVSAAISDSATDFFGKFVNASKIKDENDNLREENRTLREQMVEYEKLKQQNEQYKQFLEIKERNKDYEFEPASIIGKDPNSRFYSFTIDVGTLDDVSLRDPVITPDGLVGIVYEVGATYSKVMTLLDVSMDIGSYDAITQDTGIVTGTLDLAKQGLCKMMYLSRDSKAAVGDLVVTSGITGLFPKDLMIGTIKEVNPEEHGMSLYCLIEPAVDVKTIKDVFVIKSFSGQGSEVQTQESQASSQEQGSSSGGSEAQ